MANADEINRYGTFQENPQEQEELSRAGGAEGAGEEKELTSINSSHFILLRLNHLILTCFYTVPPPPPDALSTHLSTHFVWKETPKKWGRLTTPRLIVGVYRSIKKACDALSPRNWSAFVMFICVPRRVLVEGRLPNFFVLDPVPIFLRVRPRDGRQSGWINCGQKYISLENYLVINPNYQEVTNV
ncbi:hypothetical protein DP117_23800 [Brasilonema sp. UFV-L1]|nr:hypothetical protein [Brasilonema sp. UFV-L1]